MGSGLFRFSIVTATLGLLLSLLCAGAARAQDTGAGTFAGTVQDDSGAVLPGVTVEVASPALIEKVRNTVTDSAGRYRISGLRPGTYTVTFTLAGFRTVRNEGIVLTTGFVASINAKLNVGAVEETVTVTGAAPVVDLRSASQQQVFSGEVIRELPLGKNSGVYAALLPGAVGNNLSNMDVGGTKGETENNIGIHGGRPLDGLTFREGNYDGHMFASRGSNALSSINPATIQEVALQLTGGLTAEAQSGGIQSNAVLRDGGNRVSGSVVLDFGHRDLMSSNVDDALRQRGVTSSAFLKENTDVAGGVGGPIKRDKLWFFLDARRWKAYSEFPGNYYNKRQGSLFYEPDLSRPAISGTETMASGARITWQATQKHKLTFTGRYEDTCNCYFQLLNGTISPEAARNDRYFPYKMGQVSWTFPVTNRLLVQAGGLGIFGNWTRWASRADQNVTANDISVLDRLRNYRYGAPNAMGETPFSQSNITGSVSYLRGSHAFKVGGLYLHAARRGTDVNNQSISYTFAGAVPESVTLYAYPNVTENGINQTALFAQDQWSLGDLTLNLGLRYDGLSSYAPATHSPEGRWTPARDFPAVDGVVSWKDISPRLGASQNLFGSNRTAIKVSLGRFIGFEPLGGLAASTAPASSIVTSANRTWRDANGDYVPQESELGPLSNANFGKSVINTTYADDLLHGWGERNYSWQGSVSVQHELRPGFGVNVGYFRTWYGNFTATDNLLVSPADYDTYCITGPTDAQLPGGGGERICGLLDLKPAAFGRVSNFVAHASDYGKQSEIYNGFDFTINARFHGGAFVSGGLASSQTVTDNCDVLAALPEMASSAAPSRFCRVAPPWSAGTQFKLNGSYPLPGGLRASAVYQNIAGTATTASLLANNALVAPELGRSLAAGANATASVELVAPQSDYREGRITLLNVSLTRTFRAGSMRIQPNLDLQNLLNGNGIQAVNTRYGPVWQNVTAFVPPRMIKLGLRVDF